MGSALPRVQMDEATYLAFEEASEQRHEWYDGEIFAMAGGSDRHNVLCVNVVVLFRTRLVGQRCVPFGSDRRHHVARTRGYSYPDVVVRCRDDDQHETVPVIVEVLSEATEAFDRGDKFARYRGDAALQEYVLISQRSRSVEHFRRVDAGRWELTHYGPGDAVVLPALGLRLEVDEIYAGAEAERSDDPADPYRLD